MKTKILFLVALGMLFAYSSASAATQIILRGGDLGDLDQFRTIAVSEGLAVNRYNHYGNTAGTAAKLCALTGQYYTSLGLDKPYPVYVSKTTQRYASCWNDHNHVWKSGGWVTEGACKIGLMLTSVTCGPAPAIACSTNTDCGIDGFNGSPVCGQNNDVYKNYTTYTCNNPGTANSSCSHADEQRLFADCTANQTCQNGACVNIACSLNTDCGTNAYTGSPYCQGSNVYQNFLTWTCNNPGIASSSCSSDTAPQLKQTCSANQICSAGACQNQNIVCSANTDCGTNTYEGSPFCQGNSVYKNFRTYTCNNPGT
ncbi:MAG: hypothetical protein AAB925_01235, partial [Patescibacteria group bacterium]